MNQNKDNNLETVYIRDEIAKCENIDELIALVFPEKVDHPIVKKKLLNMINN